MKNFIYLIACISLGAISCSAQSRLLTPAPVPAYSVAPTPAGTLATISGNVNLRDNPDGLGVASSVLETLTKGEVVLLLDRNGAWCIVRHNNRIGWVLCEWVGR